MSARPVSSHLTFTMETDADQTGSEPYDAETAAFMDIHKQRTTTWYEFHEALTNTSRLLRAAESLATTLLTEQMDKQERHEAVHWMSNGLSLATHDFWSLDNFIKTGKWEHSCRPHVYERSTHHDLNTLRSKLGANLPYDMTCMYLLEALQSLSGLTDKPVDVSGSEPYLLLDFNRLLIPALTPTPNFVETSERLAS